MHIFGAIQLPAKVHEIRPVDLLDKNHGDPIFARRRHQAACGTPSFLPSAGEGYAVLLAGDVIAAALEIDHDQRRLADNQRALRVLLLAHSGLSVSFRPEYSGRRVTGRALTCGAEQVNPTPSWRGPCIDAPR